MLTQYMKISIITSLSARGNVECSAKKFIQSFELCFIHEKVLLIPVESKWDEYWIPYDGYRILWINKQLLWYTSLSNSSLNAMGIRFNSKASFSRFARTVLTSLLDSVNLWLIVNFLKCKFSCYGSSTDVVFPVSTSLSESFADHRQTMHSLKSGNE